MAGKILKIKLGYNPNSSSIGSLFTTFLWVASAGSYLMVLFSDLRTRGEVDAESAEPPESPQPNDPPADH